MDKLTDEAVQRAVTKLMDWNRESTGGECDCEKCEALRLVCDTALRQMRSEPCEKCHALYAVRTYRDGKDLGYIDIMTKYCPNCGKRMVK